MSQPQAIACVEIEYNFPFAILWRAWNDWRLRGIFAFQRGERVYHLDIQPMDGIRNAVLTSKHAQLLQI